MDFNCIVGLKIVMLENIFLFDFIFDYLQNSVNSESCVYMCLVDVSVVGIVCVVFIFENEGSVFCKLKWM